MENKLKDFMTALRILAEGRGDEEDDKVDVIANLGQRIEIVDTMNEILEDSNNFSNGLVNDLIKFVVMAEVNIGTRYDPVVVEELRAVGGAPDLDLRLADEYARISQMLGITEEDYANHVSLLSHQPEKSGLVGCLLEAWDELDSKVLFAKYISFNYLLCEKSPLLNDSWWISLIESVYFYDRNIEDSIESNDDTATANEAVRRWLSETQEVVAIFKSDVASIIDAFSPGHLITVLYEGLNDDLIGIGERVLEVLNQEGSVVCLPTPNLSTDYVSMEKWYFNNFTI